MIQLLHISLVFRTTTLGLLIAVSLVLIASSTVVKAAEVPGLERLVLLNAREQPIDLFMEELFGKLGVPARVDDDIIGSVNGDFRKTAGEVLSEIMSAFQLAVYYDGAIAHIYPANDIVRKMFYMPEKSAGQIRQSALKLGLTDSRNTLSTSDVGLIATGADRFIEQVDRLSKAMQKKKQQPLATPKHDTYRIFKLKYAWADDVSLVIGGQTVVVPGVASLIRSLIEPGSLGGAPSVLRTPAASSLDGLRGQGLSSHGVQSVGAESAILSESSRSSSEPANNIKQIHSAGGQSTANTRIVADPLSNSVIIRDQADRMSNYESLINSLDKEPQMIEIEATIIDLDTDKMRELGINWRWQGGNSQALLGNGTASDDLLRPNADVSPIGNGGVVSLVLGSRQQFISRIKALETQGAARIVSKPHVMTLSNVEALLDTTSTFFVRVAGQEEVDLFDVKVGTRLRVTPHVYESGERSQIKLRVNITDGSASEDLVDSIPVIEESNINTQAIVDVGQSLLIGGLVREIKSNGVARVPVLGRIPVLGGLFRTRIKTSTRQERMFLITPRISSRHAAGKRFSAPVLSGTEDDIVRSSALRLQRTQHALQARDETFPVQQTLPAGEGLISERSLATQYIPSSDAELNQAGEQIEDRGVGALRRRPRSDTTTQPLPADELMVNQSGGDASDQINAVIKQQGQGEWQVVGAPAVTVRVVETAADAVPAENPAEVPAEVDGWQVISQ